jgi:hypothetical protein
LLHHKEHSKIYDNTAYFKRLVNEYYPQRIEELELLKKGMMVSEEFEQVPQLFLEKLINEIATLWRAERHYWQIAETTLARLKFPKDYIVKKQQTITDLIAHLHGLLLSNAPTTEREKMLSLLSDYIEIEYKLSGLLIEKERRIYEISASERS